MTLTPEEIESLRIAIAEECGWKIENYGPEGYDTLYWRLRKPDGTIRERGCTGEDWSRAMFGHMLPPYTTYIDAIQKAAMERFKIGSDRLQFNAALRDQVKEIQGRLFFHELTALDWSIAFARTAKIWRWKA